MIPAIENVFLKYNEPTKSCLFALHAIVLNFNADMSEGLKYGMPVISYKNKPFCYLWADKKTNFPYVLVVKGDQINHPALEKGDRKKMKIYSVNPNHDINVDELSEILQAAVKLYA